MISLSYGSGAHILDDPDVNVIGKKTTHRIKNNETLIELARKFDVGYNEIVAANKYVHPWIPPDGTNITIPTEWILPNNITAGIIINLPEMRLYHFFLLDRKMFVTTYPIGIGQAGFDTPLGTFTVTAKIESPVWKVPAIIRKKRPELPPFVYPGPDNPLGDYWLSLSVDNYGIHGTNEPFGIGRKVSHGCIRLYPEDIKTLFTFIKTGTRVAIVNEPVKIGKREDKIYIEVHNEEQLRESEILTIAVEKLGSKHLLKAVNPLHLISEISKATGLPAVISE